MSEIRVLEYWRKKYRQQAIVVCVLAGVILFCGIFFAEGFWGKAFLGCLGGLFFGVMFRAVKEDFQTRFEGKLLMNAKTKFPELLFDVGRGCGEENILEQSVCPKYGVYESFNVIKAEGIIFEEVQLLENVRFFGLSFSVFEGVIVRINCLSRQNSAEGVVRLVHKTLVFEGAAAELLREVKDDIFCLLNLFGVDRAVVCVSGGAVYFWLKGAKKLYWQAHLFSYNGTQAFDKRITEVSKTGRAIADKLAGGVF